MEVTYRIRVKKDMVAQVCSDKGAFWVCQNGAGYGTKANSNVFLTLEDANQYLNPQREEIVEFIDGVEVEIFTIPIKTTGQYCASAPESSCKFLRLEGEESYHYCSLFDNIPLWKDVDKLIRCSGCVNIGVTGEYNK